MLLLLSFMCTPLEDKNIKVKHASRQCTYRQQAWFCKNMTGICGISVKSMSVKRSPQVCKIYTGLWTNFKSNLLMC